MPTHDIASQLNNIGALCQAEVCGTQHQFALSISELSPKSTIYTSNQRHIHGTVYTLLPDELSNEIAKIGRRLFEHLNEYRPYDEKRWEYHFIKTGFGKFVSLDAMETIETIRARLEDEMRRTAAKLIGNDYVHFHRKAFQIAYEFFKPKNREFRSQLRLYDGNLELYWNDIEELYVRLQELDNKIRAASGEKRLTIRDLVMPEEKAAFRLWRVPRTLDQFKQRLGISINYLGFHPKSFEGFNPQGRSKRLESLKDAYEFLHPRPGGPIRYPTAPE